MHVGRGMKGRRKLPRAVLGWRIVVVIAVVVALELRVVEAGVEAVGFVGVAAAGVEAVDVVGVIVETAVVA